MIYTIFILLIISISNCFKFDIQAEESRCFTETITQNHEVTLNYAALPGYGQHLSIIVTDPNNNVIHEQQSFEHGKWEIVTVQGGDFSICFHSKLLAGIAWKPELHRTIAFDLHIFNQIRPEHVTLANLKPFEVQLMRAADGLTTLISEYKYQKAEEWKTKILNDDMSYHMKIFGLIFFVFAAIITYCRVKYIHRTLKKKRIID